jgi:S-adenosylmethionine synthetase
LSRLYVERFGRILHHNVDKALVRGGAARPRFGGGEVLAPIEIYLAGRATSEVRGERLPIEEIARDGSKSLLRRRMHALDVDRHVEVHCLVRPGSDDLVDLFARPTASGVPRANDTSYGVGFAPFSRLETLVLAIADELEGLPSERPEIGEDVKVMGTRREGRVHLTVACAFVDRFLCDRSDYDARRAALAERLVAAVDDDVELEVNTADDASRVFMTVTGTSAEAGDDGQVGRGNRVTRLITPYRPMTLEAIDEPQLVDLHLLMRDGASLGDVQAEAREIARAEIARVPSLWSRMVAGEVRLF